MPGHPACVVTRSLISILFFLLILICDIPHGVLTGEQLARAATHLVISGRLHLFSRMYVLGLFSATITPQLVCPHNASHSSLGPQTASASQFTVLSPCVISLSIGNSLFRFVGEHFFPKITPSVPPYSTVLRGTFLR